MLSSRLIKTLRQIKQLSKVSPNWEKVYKAYISLLILLCLVAAMQFIVDVLIISGVIFILIYSKNIFISLDMLLHTLFQKILKWFI